MKIYIYPKARPHAHDTDERYIDTVPFSKSGIARHCREVEDPHYADLFYMGQFSAELMSESNPSHFPFLSQMPEKHLGDIEGDWAGVEIPAWLKQAKLTINGCPYRDIFSIVRPTMSTLLVNAAKNRTEKFSTYCQKQFGFVGLPDPWGVRLKTKKALEWAGVPHKVFFNNEFSAGVQLGHPKQTFFEELMKENLLSLCPRGMGHDSVRLYESCFYSRVPILIGDNKVVGEDFYDTSFVFRISQYLSVEQMADKLNNIYSRSHDELENRAKAARLYFDEVIREYFRDPTEYAIKHYLNG